jgi:U4/U6 small nuclear ribonucleoprotein PRP31
MSVIAAQGKGRTSGMASSMVFMPVQGMELVNAHASKDRVREANKKWFANIGFHSALPKPK